MKQQSGAVAIELSLIVLHALTDPAWVRKQKVPARRSGLKDRQMALFWMRNVLPQLVHDAGDDRRSKVVVMRIENPDLVSPISATRGRSFDSTGIMGPAKHLFAWFEEAGLRPFFRLARHLPSRETDGALALELIIRIGLVRGPKTFRKRVGGTRMRR